MKKLPTIKFAEVKKNATTTTEIVLSEGSHIVTSDGAEKFVIMNIDNYYALLPVNPNPPRQPKMVRVDGILFREVI